MTSSPQEARAGDRALPQYQRVYSLLRRHIQDGEYPVGAFLPPEPALGQKLHVSRTTVRKAVEMLIHDGFVRVRRGRGTEVLDYRAVQKLGVVTSFSETLREQGFEVSYRGVTVKTVRAPDALADDLEIEPGSELALVRRIALADGKPIAIMENHLLPDVAPDIAARAGRVTSLYAFLEAEYNLVIDAATDFISARAATRAEAAALEVATGTPLLVVKRITWSGARPIERADLNVVASRYEYSVHTRSRPGHARA